MTPEMQTAIKTLTKQHEKLCNLLYSNIFFGSGGIDTIGSTISAAKRETDLPIYLDLYSHFCTLENIALACIEYDAQTSRILAEPDSLSNVEQQIEAVKMMKAALVQEYKRFQTYIAEGPNLKIFCKIDKVINPPRYTEDTLFVLAYKLEKAFINNGYYVQDTGGSPGSPPPLCSDSPTNMDEGSQASPRLHFLAGKLYISPKLQQLEKKAHSVMQPS